MGNFYANHVLRTDDPAPVVAALERHHRNAYVASKRGATFVYDERCDAQDLDELRALAKVLSRECKQPVLAVCNHDDDVLWLALAEDGRVTDLYDSWPGYFDGGEEQPAVSNVEQLCASFDARDRMHDVATLLRKPHAEIGFEIQRHQALFDLLGLPSDISILGYEYAHRGELVDADPSIVLHRIGAESGPAHETAPAVPPDPRLLALVPTTSALALSEIEVPKELEEMLGAGRVNALLLCMRAAQYVGMHGMVAPDGTQLIVRPTGPAALLFGDEPFEYGELMPLVADHFDIWSTFSEEERTALRGNHASIRARVNEAMQQVMKHAADVWDGPKG